MYANYLYEPTKRMVNCCKIYPDLVERRTSPNYITTRSTRSFELCKQEGVDLIHLMIKAETTDIEGFARSLNTDYEFIDTKIPFITCTTSDPRDYKQYFFDFELTHQFNFTAVEPNQDPIINKLIRVMSSHKNVGIMIQFIFTCSLGWNVIAEQTAKNLSQYLKSVEQEQVKPTIVGFNQYLSPKFIVKTSPRMTELSSSTYQIGKKIEKIYQRKANSTPITLAIRGTVTGESSDIEHMIQDITSVFNTIKFVGDNLDCHIYDIDYERGQAWLENNSLCSEYSIKILQDNSNMWSDMRWGRGRDFVPFLCLTLDEFPIFVSLPTDPSLPILYRRTKLRGLNYQKLVFRLGVAI